MTITTSTVEPGIVAVTVNYPPVNAIPPSRGWFELGDAITAAGRDMNTHVVILRAEGRGFNAGVDIKEMQNTEGVHRSDRRQPRMLPRVPRGVRVRGAGGRSRQRILCRRRDRTGRQL